MPITGPASPQLDLRIDWQGPYAELKAAFPPASQPVGTTAVTSDKGPVIVAKVDGVNAWHAQVYAPIEDTP